MIETGVNTLIDSHCHLDFPQFEESLVDVVQRASLLGVNKMLTICTKPSTVDKVKSIVDLYPQIYFAAGSHPLNIGTNDIFNAADLIKLSEHPKMVGIGETGLDYYYSKETKKEQKESFRLHIDIARKCNLPLIVHARSADFDIIEILIEEHKKKEFKCVMHCFASGKELARTAIELGFYISISGIVTFPKSQELRDVISNIPLNKLLLETDSPFLSPVPKRGKVNEPSFVSHTANYLAKHLNLSQNSIRNITTQNFYTLFEKVVN